MVDFESKHFIGTLFLRIKQVPSHRRKERINQDDDINNTVEDGQNNQGDYFADKKRKFQAIVKGSFKTPLSLSRCMTGQLFERPAGPLPARWIVKSFIKFISILAPRKSFLFNSKNMSCHCFHCVFISSHSSSSFCLIHTKSSQIISLKKKRVRCVVGR